MNIKCINILPLAALACAATVTAAQAATLTFTQTVATTTAPRDFIAPFSQFDPTLGTLTGAELTVNETTTGSSYLENLMDSGFFSFGGGRAGIEVFMPTVADIGTSSFWGTNRFFAAFDGAADFSGADTVFNAGSDSSSISSQFSDAASLNKFIGTSFLFSEITVTTDTGLFLSRDFNVLSVDAASGDVSLTYTYTPNGGGPTGGVPEPASWALMVLGVGGIGAMTRARRRQARLSLVAG